MQRLRPSALLLLPLLLALSEPIRGQDFSQLRQRVRSSIVHVETLSEKRDGTNREVISGTGFVISPLGYAITAAHVVPRPASDGIAQYRASVTSRHSAKFSIEVVYRQEELDLALLLFPSVQTWQALDFGNSSETPEDARLYVLGFPRASDLASAEGLLSSRFGTRGNWQTTLPIDYGNSGGPVFDIGGRVVGIAAGGLDEARAMTYVIPSNYSRPIRSLTQASFDVGIMTAVKMNPFFVITADHQQQRELEQLFCLEPQYKVTSFSPTVTATYGDTTKIVSIAPAIGKDNCVALKAFVAGDGVDRIGPITVKQKGQGALAGRIFIGGEPK